MRHFFEFFFVTTKAPPSIFYIPSSSIFLMSPKGSPFHTLEQTGISKSPKGPPFYNFKNFVLFESDIAPTLAVPGLFLNCRTYVVYNVMQILVVGTFLAKLCG